MISNKLVLVPTLALLLGLLLMMMPVQVLSVAYEDQPDVQVLETMEQFETTVLQSTGLWMVQFCTHTDKVCQDMEANFSVMASLYRGIVHLGYVDFGTPEGQEIVQRFQIPTRKIPVLYWFLDDKQHPTKIESLQEMETMVGHIMQTMASTISSRAEGLGLGMEFNSKSNANDANGRPRQGKSSGGSSKVVSVSGSDEWEQLVLNSPLVTLVAFTAPWCGHCKLLQSEYEEAAAKLDGQGAQLVWVDATDDRNQQVAAQFQVQGYPTMFIFPGGAPKKATMARQYPSERKAKAIVEYVLNEVDVSGSPKEIPELVSQDILKAECQGQNRICIMAALPHILDSGAAGRDGYRDLLAQVRKTFRGGAFSFLWFQGGDQPALETALELTFGYPALVAYSMDRHAFAVLHGSFSEKRMTSFLHGVTSGRVPVAKLAQEKVPKIETVEPWDGQDAAPPEEEFSLDDIMGDSDEDNEEASSDGGNEEL